MVWMMINQNQRKRKNVKKDSTVVPTKDFIDNYSFKRKTISYFIMTLKKDLQEIHSIQLIMS
jgi:hypothetical protein